MPAEFAYSSNMAPIPLEFISFIKIKILRLMLSKLSCPIELK